MSSTSPEVESGPKHLPQPPSQTASSKTRPTSSVKIGRIPKHALWGLLVVVPALAVYAPTSLRNVARFLLLPPLLGAFGLTMAVVMLLVAAARAEARSPPPPFSRLQRNATRPLVFTRPERWKEVMVAMEREAGGAGGDVMQADVGAALREAASLQIPLAATSRAAVPGFESPAVAARLDAILGLIRMSFVLPWYSKISPSRAFPDAVEGIIRHALGAAARRAEDVDWPSLATARLLPIVTEHLQHFRTVEHLSAAPSSPEKGLPLPLPSHAHPALTARNVSPDADIPVIEAHLRGHVQRALVALLPDKERTDVVAIMAQEIVLGAILMPLFNMLCDSDFWNRQISEQGAKLLHERKQVNKVLSALSSVPPPQTSPRTRKAAVTASSITATSTTKEFEEFMRSIPKLRTLGEARRLRADVDRELRSARAAQRVAGSETGKEGRRAVRYVHRLERARWQIDRCIVSLSGKTEMGRSLSDSPIARRAAAVSLSTILADPSCLAYWLEHMERRGRSHLVQFWLTVEGFKDPLDTGGLGLKTEDRGKSASTMRDDLAFLHATYFSSSEHAIAVAPRLVQAVAELSQLDSLTAEQVEQGRRVMSEAQRAVYDQMEEEDWAGFKKSELYLKALAELKDSTQPRHTRSLSTNSPPGSPTLRLVPPQAQPKPRSASDQPPRSPRPYLVNGSFVPVTPAAPSTTMSTRAPDMTQRRLTPEGSANTSPRRGPAVIPHRASTSPQPRRSVYLDTLIGEDESERDRDPLFSDDKDDEREHLEAQRMEAIQAALDEIIAEDGSLPGSRKVSESLEHDHQDEREHSENDQEQDQDGTPSPYDLDVDPLSLSTPGLIETPRPFHPLAGKKITSRSAEDLKAIASPARPAPAPVQRIFRRGSADVLHRRSKSIFADSNADADDEPEALEGVSAVDLLVPPSAAPGDLQLAETIARLETKLGELRTQDALLDSLIGQAELTGNSKELKLLNRSQSSLRRELRTVELEVAQYRRQEEENRLVPGRTRATIPQATTEGQVVRYTVEIAQLSETGRVVVGWAVVHRYSEFWELDRALRDDPLLTEPMRSVSDLPSKRLVPLTSSLFVEARRSGLEKYLQSVLAQSELCDAPPLRSFLSRRSGPEPQRAQTAPSRLVQTLYRTVAGGLEDSSGLGMPPMLDLMTQGLSRQIAEVAGGVQGVTELMAPLRGPWAPKHSPDSATPSSTMTDKAATEGVEAQEAAEGKEEQQLPPTLAPLGGEGAPGGFTAPICDLFIEVFDLKERDWLRRQAIVILLQQVLGGTIERKFRDAFRKYSSPRKVDRLLTTFQNGLWPGGQRRPDTPPRTDAECVDARITASRRLGMLIPDVAANMIGRGNARRAAHLVWGALQDRRLNQHLVLCIIDEVDFWRFVSGFQVDLFNH